MREQRKPRNSGTRTHAPELPVRIVDMLVNGGYADLVVGRALNRRVFLPEIISLHTRKELRAINGIGSAGINRIEAWLRDQGYRLRQRGESLDAVICGFSFRRLKIVRREIPARAA